MITALCVFVWWLIGLIIFSVIVYLEGELTVGDLVKGIFISFGWPIMLFCVLQSYLSDEWRTVLWRKK